MGSDFDYTFHLLIYFRLKQSDHCTMANKKENLIF